jgi:Tol biopolymer transport system component
MASIIPGYEYDIFISYRQKDNKHDGWVTEFVDNLKGELEATFKEEISVYFDINPHDGLLETHDVDESLKEKLKCLIFIPIISRTYCDPKSFAWEHEFKAFIELASHDQFGLKIKLPNGNVASRVLPIRIYDLNETDLELCETLLGGVMRGIEFIYSEPGVNRPLKPDDDEKISLKRTKYRNQINKVGNAIQEILSGLQIEPINLVKEKLLKKESSELSVISKVLKKSTSLVGPDKRKEERKKYLWLGAGVLLFVAVIAIIIWSPGSEVQLSPKRTIRTLNLPFKQIMYPSISSDGNWIAFPAVDVHGNWNIYFSHSSSGETPISISNEGDRVIFSAVISPDGSYVLYYVEGERNPRIIPASGGVPKILDGIGEFMNPQWSPDGRRLGGIKTNGGYREFWTFSPNGTGLRKEFTDTIGGQLFRNFGFAWSPDGKSLAWMRDFEEGTGYQEIFIHNLDSGKENQLTYAKSNIEAVCWSKQNVIIFSATISGPLNLWMVPAGGGELTQITSGDGPDGPPHISTDCRIIIYPKMKMIGQIMVVPIDGGDPKLVTEGEQTIWFPGAKLSPDKSQVSVSVGDLRFGWAGVRAHLYIMDRNGMINRRITVSEGENLGSHTWSADGRWLSFRSGPFFNKSGHNVHILDAVGNNQPKKISLIDQNLSNQVQVNDLFWIDSFNLSIHTKDKFFTYSIDNDKMVPETDTVLYYAVTGRSEVLMLDLEGIWWIIKDGKKNMLKPPDGARLSLRNLCWTQWGPGQPFRTTSLIDGKVKEYPNLIGPRLLGIYNLSDDGKEIIFSTREFSGQISIIENPFLK